MHYASILTYMAFSDVPLRIGYETFRSDLVSSFIEPVVIVLILLAISMSEMTFRVQANKSPSCARFDYSNSTTNCLLPLWTDMNCADGKPFCIKTNGWLRSQGNGYEIQITNDIFSRRLQKQLLNKRWAFIWSCAFTLIIISVAKYSADARSNANWINNGNNGNNIIFSPNNSVKLCFWDIITIYSMIL